MRLFQVFPILQNFAKCKRLNQCYNFHGIENEYCRSEAVCYEKQYSIQIHMQI